ncbi:hypothetical protein VIGAN_11125300 [Vigna angularis var. angularis]|uniref:Uncharacterized protein n=1 Tax=Vigna angularis var. angularis TaxID=157739 RepID=A0A0S3TAF9_PHAAN|nr:hypothetical protein VIGAN_11125300 [Vigna angularis var. angularis]
MLTHFTLASIENFSLSREFLSRKSPFLFTDLHFRFTRHPITSTARVSHIPSSFSPLPSIPSIKKSFSTDYNHILPIIIPFHRLHVDLKDVVAVEVIAARAADLEMDVARLQHDLISEMTASEEARTDASELRKDLGEKESLVESLEKELTALKKVKAENAVRVRDLERKIGILETKEIGKRNKED